MKHIFIVDLTKYRIQNNCFAIRVRIGLNKYISKSKWLCVKNGKPKLVSSIVDATMLKQQNVYKEVQKYLECMGKKVELNDIIFTKP